MTHVLRLKKGEPVVLSDGGGAEATATIVAMEEGGVQLMVELLERSKREPEREVVLYCSLLKRENFEWAVQKATEVGVSRIVPIQSLRTIKLGVKRDRLEKIIREAAEQSGRATVPTLEEAQTLSKALAHAHTHPYRWFFDLDGTPAASIKRTASASTAIFIGPEGGWDAAERNEAEAAGCAVVSLGPLTLRAETAATIASYLACSV